MLNTIFIQLLLNKQAQINNSLIVRRRFPRRP